MQLSQMRYFIEIAKTKNISLAAKNLHLSQPSLSFAIKSLEEELGVALLTRHSKSVSLTDAGEKFASHAEIILGSTEQLGDLMKRHSKLLAGNLRLGMLWIGGYMNLFSLLNKFREKFPDISYELTFEGSDVLMQSLINRRLHGAFVISSKNSLEARDNFYYKEISKEEYVLIVPKNNKLCKKNKISIKDLKDEVIIMPSEKTLLNRQLLMMFQNDGINPKVLCSTSQSDIVGQLTGENLGIGFASSTVAEKICSENCRIIPFDDSAKIHRVIYFITLQELIDYPLIKAFTDFLEKFY